MPIIPTTKEFNLTLSSTPENVSRVEPFLQQIHRIRPIKDDLYFNILVVLTEAVNNSILHGNQANPRKKVSVRMLVNGKTLSFTIQDEGKGFNPSQIPDPTSPEQILTPNGRGVFLMRELSDALQYSNRGRCVDIQFNI